MNKKIQERINQKYDLIRQKEEEIKQLRVDIDNLEAKKFENQLKLVIKCSPSMDYMRNYIDPTDINMDIDYDKKEARSPKEQAKYIMDIIENIMKDKKSNNVFVVYTVHSDILNCIGSKIAYKKIPSGIIKVIMFDKDSIKESKYDSSGFLTNWPIGFLSWT